MDYSLERKIARAEASRAEARKHLEDAEVHCLEADVITLAMSERVMKLKELVKERTHKVDRLEGTDGQSNVRATEFMYRVQVSVARFDNELHG
jgi:hypothetical protein